MERPKRTVRPPGALNDFLTANEAEKKPILEGEDVTVGQIEQECTDNDTAQTDTEKKLLLSQPYKCRECKARYRSKVALLRHAVKHSGEHKGAIFVVNE